MNDKYYEFLNTIDNIRSRSNDLQNKTINNYIKGINIMMKKAPQRKIIENIISADEQYLETLFRKMTIDKYGFDSYNKAQSNFYTDHVFKNAISKARQTA